jgi:hypothetical protein
MAIDAHVRGVGEVGGELDEQRPEVLIEQVEVVVITQHRTPAEPGKGVTGVLAEPLGDTEAGELLLGLADIEHTLGSGKTVQSLLGDLILALALGKGEDLHPLALGEVADGPHEGMTHGAHECGRGHLGTAMMFEEGRHAASALQHRLVQIQIQAIDPFHIQRDLLCQQLPHGLSYHACRPRLTLRLYATPPLHAATNGSIAFRRSTGASPSQPMTSRSEAEPR